MDSDNDITVESGLTKGDKVPSIDIASDISALIGETTKSKLKEYAAVECKKLTTHYVGTISSFTGKLEKMTKKF